MIWFTSDTHFGHTNILKHDPRPFSSIQEHDKALIENWNRVVHPRDVVYHLGDVSWRQREVDVNSLLRLLHGTKILIKGNHDRSNKPVLTSCAWSKVCDYEEITVGTQKVILFHYRMVVWNGSHHGSWALHGHSHGSLPINLRAKTIDVGTMCWGFRPISYDEVAEEMGKHTNESVDGHTVKVW